MKPHLLSGTSYSTRKPYVAELGDAAQPQPAAESSLTLSLNGHGGPSTGVHQDKPASRRLHRKQAATYIGLSLSWLDKSRLRGDGPAFLEIGGRVLYDVSDLDEYLARCRRRSTSDAG